jgi:hypothetical protein
MAFTPIINPNPEVEKAPSGYSSFSKVYFGKETNY